MASQEIIIHCGQGPVTLTMVKHPDAELDFILIWDDKLDLDAEPTPESIVLSNWTTDGIYTILATAGPAAATIAGTDYTQVTSVKLGGGTVGEVGLTSNNIETNINARKDVGSFLLVCGIT